MSIPAPFHLEPGFLPQRKVLWCETDPSHTTGAAVKGGGKDILLLPRFAFMEKKGTTYLVINIPGR